MSSDDNVFKLQIIQGRGDRSPPLSDAEIVAMRAMLAQWQIVKRGDPMIRWLTDEG